MIAEMFNIVGFHIPNVSFRNSCAYNHNKIHLGHCLQQENFAFKGKPSMQIFQFPFQNVWKRCSHRKFWWCKNTKNPELWPNWCLRFAGTPKGGGRIVTNTELYQNIPLSYHGQVSLNGLGIFIFFWVQIQWIPGRAFIHRQTSASMGTPEETKTRGFGGIGSTLPSKKASWLVNYIFK